MGNVQVKYEFDGIDNPWIYKAKELEKQKEIFKGLNIKFKKNFIISSNTGKNDKFQIYKVLDNNPILPPDEPFNLYYQLALTELDDRCLIKIDFIKYHKLQMKHDMKLNKKEFIGGEEGKINN